ncbi:hypothetical protein ACTJJ7_24525 [Phyllobacterium sp. 22229]|uniref:hypothetical protein n=1 Tax=Phyllobacterium TaxID=28100 RepID=UPI001FDF8101|nr:hypothetical protein [Phyllobacterium myrsinacearum]
MTLADAGCKNIYEEKVSGAKRDRIQLARVLDHLRDTDVVAIHIGPELCAFNREAEGEVLTGERAGQPLNRETGAFQVPTFFLWRKAI